MESTVQQEDCVEICCLKLRGLRAPRRNTLFSGDLGRPAKAKLTSGEDSSASHPALRYPAYLCMLHCFGLGRSSDAFEVRRCISRSSIHYVVGQALSHDSSVDAYVDPGFRSPIKPIGPTSSQPGCSAWAGTQTRFEAQSRSNRLRNRWSFMVGSGARMRST
jgi:hypothetical protein